MAPQENCLAYFAARAVPVGFFFAACRFLP
jgi:hypothetical protein